MALRSTTRVVTRLTGGARALEKPWVRTASAMPEEIEYQQLWSPPQAEVPDYDGWDDKLEADFLPRRNTTGQSFHQSRPPVGNPRAGICESVLDLVGQTPMVSVCAYGCALTLPPCAHSAVVTVVWVPACAGGRRCARTGCQDSNSDGDTSLEWQSREQKGPALQLCSTCQSGCARAFASTPPSRRPPIDARPCPLPLRIV